MAEILRAGIEPGWSVREATGVTDVDAADWDRLALPNVHLSHAWLAALETDEVPRARYLAVRAGRAGRGGRGGRLLGAVPVYEQLPAPPGGLSDPATIFGTPVGEPPERADGRWSAVRAGPRMGFDGNLLLAPDLPPADRIGVVRALLAAVERQAPVRTFLHVNPVGADQLAPALGPGWKRVFTTATAVIPTGFGSFEDYLAGLPSRRRSRVRREIRGFAEHYRQAGREPLARCVEELAPLSAALHAKYGGTADVRRQRRFYTAVSRSMGERAVVFTARQDGELVGYALGLDWGGMLYLRSVGFDYPRLVDAFEYFQVTFYEPIRYAVEHGLTAVHLGIESPEAKLLRGARLLPLWSLVSGVAGIDQADLDELGAGRLSGWDERVGGRASRSPSLEWQWPARR